MLEVDLGGRAFSIETEHIVGEYQRCYGRRPGNISLEIL